VTTSLRLAHSLGLLLLPWLVGCATILQGETQMVQITSHPPGATVTVLPEMVTLVTPGEVDLTRKQIHTLLFELECYEPAIGYLDRTNSNVTAGNLLLGGIIGMLVDLDTGAAFRLIPDPLHVQLARSRMGNPGACIDTGRSP
jgi:hypothetical protein